MGIQLPDWVRTMFLVMTGDGWPEADEDDLRALARVWTDIGHAISDLESRIADPVRAVRRTDWDGPAAEAFAAASSSLAGREGGRQLAGFAQGSQELSDFIYETGVNVQYMKFIVLSELFILAAQIVYLIAMGPWTFGASTAAVPAFQSAGRSFALMAARQLAISIASGQALQIGLDATVQLTQLALHTRKRWNTDLTVSAAITGAVGGVLGPLAGGMGHLLGRAVNPVLGKRLARPLREAVSNAAHEYATSAGTGVVTGQGWVGTPWDLTAGGISGLLSHQRGRREPAVVDIPDVPALSARTEHAAVVSETSEQVPVGSSSPVPAPPSPAPRTAAAETPTPGPVPPSRLRTYGRLSASDVVIGWYPDDVLPWRSLAEQLAPRFGAAWQQAEPILWESFSAATVRAQLTSVAQGDRWVVDVDRNGWQGTIALDAVFEDFTWDHDVAKFEFENGSESQAGVGRVHDVRWQFSGGPAVLVTAPGGQYRLALGAYDERNRALSSGFDGRTVGTSKTVEAACIWNGRLAVRLAIDLTRRNERIAVSDLEITTAVRIATPKADSPGADGLPPTPTQHYAPPVRVQTGQRLGSSDIVRDVYSLLIRPSTLEERTTVHARGGGMQPVLDQLDETGRKVFGDEWAAVKIELLSQVRFATLHQHLKSMMSGQPLSLPLSSVPGQVDITARVTTMHHVRSTPQTEFNVGTEVRRSLDTRRARTVVAEATGHALVEELAPFQGRLAGRGQIGGDGERAGGSLSRTGMSTKTKAPGELFDGVVALTFMLRRNAFAHSEQQNADVSLGFRAVVERAEAVPVSAATPWRFGDPVIRPATTAMETPQATVPHAARLPPARVWSGTQGEGLRDTDVVSDLFGIEKVHAAIEEGGKGFFGPLQWPHIRGLVIDGFHPNQLAASLPAMTRGYVFEGPALDSRGLAPGSAVSATGRMVSMNYRRTVETQLSPRNERSVDHSEQRTRWWAGQVMVEEGGTTQAAGGLTPLGAGGAEYRQLTGVRHIAGGKTVSNAKFPAPVAIFDSEVELTFTFASIVGSLTRQVRVPVEVAIPAGETLTVTLSDGMDTLVTPENYSALLRSLGDAVTPASGLFAGKPPSRLLVPPDRLHVDGRLGSSDVVTYLGQRPTVVADAIGAAVGERLGAAWRAVQNRVRHTYNLFSLRPNLAALTSGDAVEVPISGSGWSGGIRLRAEIDGLAHQETIEQTEFEAGTETSTMIGARHDSRWRSTIATTLRGNAPHTLIMGTLAHYRDLGNTTITHSGAGVLTMSKTVEPAAVFTGTVKFTAEFTLRRFGVPVHQDDVRVDVPVQVLVPERESSTAGSPVPTAPAPMPEERLVPPRRVLETLRLSGSDVVLDLAPPKPRPGQPSRGMVDVLSAVDRQGRKMYGRAWPAARSAILAEVDIARLRQELKTMIAGQPIMVAVPHGRVLITAQLLHLGQETSTKQTEFISGTQRRSALTVSERNSDGAQTAGDRDNGAAVIASARVLGTIDPTGESPVVIGVGGTGTVAAGVETTQVRSLAGNAAMSTKTKGPGVVFAGSIQLNIRFEQTPRIGPQQVSIAHAPVRFSALIERRQAQSRSPSGGGDHAAEPPAVVWVPPARVWSTEAGEGLRDTDVVHGLPDTGGIMQALDAEGRALYGPEVWRKISGIVFDTVSNVQLAAHLPSMTRGEPLVSPPLLGAPTDPPGAVSVTAQLVQLTYVRHDAVAELNPINESTDQRHLGRQHWSALGGQAELGVVATLPAVGIYASLQAGAQRRGHTAIREILTGRVRQNGKFAEPAAHYEGYVKFTTTLRRGDKERTFAGLAPVELSIPVSETIAVDNAVLQPIWAFDPDTRDGIRA